MPATNPYRHYIHTNRKTNPKICSKKFSGGGPGGMRRCILCTSISYTPHVAFCSKSSDFGFAGQNTQNAKRVQKGSPPPQKVPPRYIILLPIPFRSRRCTSYGNRLSDSARGGTYRSSPRGRSYLRRAYGRRAPSLPRQNRARRRSRPR